MAVSDKVETLTVDAVAQLSIITNWTQAGAYLQMLKSTIEDDVRPLLATKGEAPFAVSREVLSYIDHLGHLYSGCQPVGQRTKEYLENVLAQVDGRYRQMAQEIYEMYRNGAVHQFEPKTLENHHGQTLEWFCYSGKRTDQVPVNGVQTSVTHLALIAYSENHFWLPVSTLCLLDDLVSSVDVFAEARPDDARVQAWNRAVQNLRRPHKRATLPRWESSSTRSESSAWHRPVLAQPNA